MKQIKLLTILAFFACWSTAMADDLPGQGTSGKPYEIRIQITQCKWSLLKTQTTTPNHNKTGNRVATSSAATVGSQTWINPIDKKKKNIVFFANSFNIKF